MKKIRVLHNKVKCGTHISTIVKFFAARKLECTQEQALEMWLRYSAKSKAGWNKVNTTSGYVVEVLRPYFEVLE